MKPIKEIAEMDDAALRVACAELDGYRREPKGGWYRMEHGRSVLYPGIWDYTRSHDGMHAALARHITPFHRDGIRTDGKANVFQRFEFALHSLCTTGPVWHASARVLAVCFVWAMQEE